jgi:serine/threonine-protein kinase
LTRTALRDKLRIRNGTLVQVIGEIVSALAAAWSELQLVHRDIKPANIRVGRHGQVKLLDFGIASTDQLTRAAKTATGMVLGTMPFMAPERFMVEGVQPAADVFALGVTLLQGLTGRGFYGRKTPVSLIVGLAADPDPATSRSCCSTQMWVARY